MSRPLPKPDLPLSNPSETLGELPSIPPSNPLPQFALPPPGPVQAVQVLPAPRLPPPRARDSVDVTAAPVSWGLFALVLSGLMTVVVAGVGYLSYREVQKLDSQVAKLEGITDRVTRAEEKLTNVEKEVSKIGGIIEAARPPPSFGGPVGSPVNGGGTK